ncbi:MAG: hypothetical protein UR87_C0015G0003 [candidate division CPR3 bacterium GW2011_GWE2_35_7]|nr:MAG: hypothetical protein UR87_C0015G0003 [candidate division CPR3 bacterium GW2011_GWE2_35_7]
MEENKKTSFTNILKYLAVFASITIIGFLILTYQNKQNNPEIKGVTEQKQEETVKANPYSVIYQGEDTKNALELLKSKENVVTKQSSFGEYVNEINGIKGGTDNKYWIFYVNGKMSEVGADDYVTKSLS